MTRKETREWLNGIEPLLTKDATEKAIDWIIEALKELDMQLDTECLRSVMENKPDIRNAVFAVAYGTPNLSLKTRKAKPFFHSMDVYEFYSLEQKEWSEYWQRTLSKNVARHILKPNA